MAKEILTPLQKRFIASFAAQKQLNKGFYLTGGTALAAYYLKHRHSEDLDFFSYDKVDNLVLSTFLKDIKPRLGIVKIDFQESFNRNIFFLHTKKEILKVEFTYFPFDQIQKPAKKDGIYIDSSVDIAVNKAFTIYQNPRARDFIDLYFILRKHGQLSFRQLFKMARAKFDTHIDPLQLGTQLFKAKDIKDIPRMISRIDHKLWRSFFLAQAKSLSGDILR